MKRLKFTFGALYAVLILLLLLLMLKHCENPQTEEPAEEPVEQTDDQPEDEQSDDEAIARRTGEMGNLKVTLLWDKVGDVDLHVVEPNGTHIWFDNKTPAGGSGRLDRDNTNGGRGSVENIYWDNPPQGRYKVYVNYFRSTNSESIPCRVLIFKQGELVNEYSCVLNNMGEIYNFPDIVIE